ncbi:MAG: hypothetical protein IJ228_12075 [Succinivibrio sp.]|nr:hypothetical protein [Succinivibrio sp.]
MIFLSASIPVSGRPFGEDSRPEEIKKAVRAFVSVCLEQRRAFYFGGHPSITPVVEEATMSAPEKSRELITLYQSAVFGVCEADSPLRTVITEAAVAVSELKREQKPIQPELIALSVELMRRRMFKDHPDTDAAVFIGGMDGILVERELLLEYCPNARLLPLPDTGGATAYLYGRLSPKEALLSGHDYERFFKTLLDVGMERGRTNA